MFIYYQLLIHHTIMTYKISTVKKHDTNDKMMLITIDQIDYSNDELDYFVMNEIFMKDAYTINMSNSSDISLSFIFENKMHTYVFHRYYENDQIYMPYYETVNYVSQRDNNIIVSFDLQFDNVKDLPCIDEAMKIINKTMDNWLNDCTRKSNSYLNYCDHIKRYVLKKNDDDLYCRVMTHEIEQNIIFPIFICASVSIGFFKSTTNTQYIYMCILHTMNNMTSIFVVRLKKYKSDHFGLNMTGSNHSNGEPNIKTNLLCDNKNKKYHINIFQSKGELPNNFYGQ